MKIEIIGSIFGYSGYAIHTRYLANALNDLGVDVRLNCPVPPDKLKDLSDVELSMLKKPDNPEERTGICINLPPTYPLYRSKKYKKFIGFLVWEGSTIPAHYLPFIHSCDSLFVPSVHVANALNKTYAKHKYIYQKINSMYIIPHGHTVTHSNTYPKQNDTLRILWNKGWNGTMYDRGGIQYFLPAFNEAFKDCDDVNLTIKINPSYIHPSINISESLGEKFPFLKDNKRVDICTTIIQDMEYMYDSNDVYVCTQMADGFNIGGIDAMARGLPTLQSFYGGQSDYINEGKDGWCIYDGIFEESKDLMYADTKWFIPCKDAIKEKLLNIYELWKNNKLDEYKKQALLTSNQFSWSNTAKKIIDILKNES